MYRQMNRKFRSISGFFKRNAIQNDDGVSIVLCMNVIICCYEPNKYINNVSINIFSAASSENANSSYVHENDRDDDEHYQEVYENDLDTVVSCTLNTFVVLLNSLCFSLVNYRILPVKSVQN